MDMTLFNIDIFCINRLINRLSEFHSAHRPEKEKVLSVRAKINKITSENVFQIPIPVLFCISNVNNSIGVRAKTTNEQWSHASSNSHDESQGRPLFILRVPHFRPHVTPHTLRRSSRALTSRNVIDVVSQQSNVNVEGDTDTP